MPKLSEKQHGVAKGMALAAGTVVVSFGVTGLYATKPTHTSPGWRHKPLLGPALCLAGNIGIIAKHRFFTPQDIDGSGMTEGTTQIKILQATLQNTLEQAALAVPVYLATSEDLQPLPLVSSACFVLGRIFFWRGYSKGAPSRAYGFALTFYSTVTLLVLNIGSTAMEMARGR